MPPINPGLPYHGGMRNLIVAAVIIALVLLAEHFGLIRLSAAY